MTMIFLAMLITNPASPPEAEPNYRLLSDLSGIADAPGADSRRWSPGVDGWIRRRDNCAPSLTRAIPGFGQIRIGPDCEEEIPYAL